MRREKIRGCIQGFLDSGRHIWKADQVKAELMGETDEIYKRHEVTDVLRSDFNMSYRMVKQVAFQGNS